MGGCCREAVQEIPDRDVISWSTMILGYVQNGALGKGWDFFRQLIAKGLRENYATLVTVLCASAQLGLLEIGKFIHSNIRSVNSLLLLALPW